MLQRAQETIAKNNCNKVANITFLRLYAEGLTILFQINRLVTYCNQLFSAQMKTRAVRTGSTDVNKIWQISIDYRLFVNFSRFKTWKIPIELQTMWLKSSISFKICLESVQLEYCWWIWWVNITVRKCVLTNILQSSKNHCWSPLSFFTLGVVFQSWITSDSWNSRNCVTKNERPLDGALGNQFHVSLFCVRVKQQRLLWTKWNPCPLIWLGVYLPGESTQPNLRWFRFGRQLFNWRQLAKKKKPANITIFAYRFCPHHMKNEYT